MSVLEIVRHRILLAYYAFDCQGRSKSSRASRQAKGQTLSMSLYAAIPVGL